MRLYPFIAALIFWEIESRKVPKVASKAYGLTLRFVFWSTKKCIMHPLEHNHGKNSGMFFGLRESFSFR